MAVKAFTIMMAAAFAAVAAGIGPAEAGRVRTGSCVGSGWWWGSVSCSTIWGWERPGGPNVIYVPRPSDDRAMAESADRERRWLARCRPVVQQDRYGVPRYTYAARGCEFGRWED